MTQLHSSDDARPAPRGGHRAALWSWFRGTTAIAALAVLGGALLAQHTTSSPGSLTLTGAPGAVPALQPPAGSTWITGTLTDQAAHGQDNVNVEAWPVDPAATAPVASSLTYGGPNYHAVSAHGFFRLQVPSNRPYRIVFSAVGGKEDGDRFRIQRYGHGRPIVARSPGRAAAGRIRDLGTIQLVRQGRVPSKAEAVALPTKVQVGRHGKLRVSVTSRYVTHVKGRVVVNVAGHRLQGRMKVSDHGKLTMTLPMFHRPGKYRVVARFVGTNTVHASQAKPIKLRAVK